MTNEEMMKVFMPVGLSLALIAGGLAHYKVVNDGRTSKIEELEKRVSELGKANDTKKSEVNEARTSAIVESTGIDRARLSSDAEVGEHIASLMCTWSNWQEYEDNRKAIIKEFGFSPDEGFMADMMPYIGKGSSSNDEYNVIDSAGLNMSLDGFDAYLVHVDGPVYTYLAEFGMSSEKDGRSATSKAMMIYSIDSTGAITNIYGSLLD